MEFTALMSGVMHNKAPCYYQALEFAATLIGRLILFVDRPDQFKPADVLFVRLITAVRDLNPVGAVDVGSYSPALLDHSFG